MYGKIYLWLSQDIVIDSNIPQKQNKEMEIVNFQRIGTRIELGCFKDNMHCIS